MEKSKASALLTIDSNSGSDGGIVERRGSHASTEESRFGSKLSKYSIPQIQLEGATFDNEVQRPSSASSWNDSLFAEDHDELRLALAKVHPQLRFEHELDHKREIKALHAQLNPTRRFNALLVAGDSTISRVRAPSVSQLGKQVVPQIVVVTGHRGAGGNAGLNGVYERYPDDYQNRPVYQKFLEKRVAPESEGPVSRGQKDWIDRNYSTRLLMNRDKKSMSRPLSMPELGKPPQIRPARDAWFLFFAHDQGCWCIGPRIGSGEVYAICPGADELVPTGLFGWRVFDVDRREWYSHKSLQAIKGGSTANFRHN